MKRKECGWFCRNDFHSSIGGVSSSGELSHFLDPFFVSGEYSYLRVCCNAAHIGGTKRSYREHIVHRQIAQWWEQNVRMEGFGERLRARAKELDLSDAEVARKAGLGTRRYGHYVTGSREPDLLTLIRICSVLHTTPNHVLGFKQLPADGKSQQKAKKKLEEMLVATCSALDLQYLRLALTQIEALLRHQAESSDRKS